MKRPVSVVIAGQRYQLRSDQEERQVKQIAQFVDGRIREVQKATRNPDTQAAAVLAALQIAEELFEARAAQAETKRRVREQGQRLLGLIEKHARV